MFSILFFYLCVYSLMWLCYNLMNRLTPNKCSSTCTRPRPETNEAAARSERVESVNKCRKVEFQNLILPDRRPRGGEEGSASGGTDGKCQRGDGDERKGMRGWKKNQGAWIEWRTRNSARERQRMRQMLMEASEKKSSVSKWSRALSCVESTQSSPHFSVDKVFALGAVFLPLSHLPSMDSSCCFFMFPSPSLFILSELLSLFFSLVSFSPALIRFNHPNEMWVGGWVRARCHYHHLSRW